MTVQQYKVQLDVFEGPLDLLLQLIEENKLDITQISLAKVTDDFLNHLQTLKQINHLFVADFLVIASRLILIKSKLLLPMFELTEEEEEQVADLERRLEEYQRFKQLAEELKKIFGAKKISFTREAYLESDTLFYPPKDLKAGDLHHLLIELIKQIPEPQKVEKERLKKIITLEEKINHFLALLENKIQRSFQEFLKNPTDKSEVIVAFLAMLELAKRQILTIQQKGNFGNIILIKYNKNSA